MPYITKAERVEIDKEIDNLIAILPEALGTDIKDGVVNYTISRIIDGLYSGKDYAHYNRALGVLEAVKLEYYRRVVAEYENSRCNANGDVFK